MQRRHGLIKPGGVGATLPERPGGGQPETRKRLMRYHPALFIPGPTNIPDEVRRAMNVPMEDMRAPDFPKLTLALFEDLKRVFKTETGQGFIFPGSGTGGWEAGLTNTLSPGDTVLASRIGQLSHLWIGMCKRIGLDV